MRYLLFLPLLFISFVDAFSQPEKINFRDDFDILHYSINLNITDFQNQLISGNTLIQMITNKPETSEINLELLNMEIDSVFLFKQKIENYSYNGKILTFPFKPELSQGKCCTQVTVYYHGHPVQDSRWGGFFFNDSTAYNMGVGMGSNPVSFGRVWFPCIDSFTEKATYEFNITVPKGFKAVCSGTLISETDNKDARVTFIWKMNQEVPVYLVSVAVAKYDLIESVYQGIKREIPVDLYIFAEDKANAIFSFQNLPKALRTYENDFGEYVWERVGYVEVPFSSGAMEHVCNIAYPDYAVDSTLFRETLMAHELSHHWFGNLVTCKTPQDMWLNEGWATYAEALFQESVYGKEAFKDYVRENHAKVLTMTPIYDNGFRALYGIPLEYTYGSTVYDKGGDVAHTLRGYMGDSLFFKSLTAYIKAFSYKAASTYEFRNFMSECSGIQLNNFFDTWVFTEGFPHFSIDKFIVEKINNNYRADVSINQKLKARTFYGQDNLMELTFVDEHLNLHSEKINMSGTNQLFNFVLPYKPVNAFLDLDENMSDASIDNYKLFSDTGVYDFAFTDFSVTIKSCKGKAVIQSIMNYVTPNNSEHALFTLSKEKYWEIRGATVGKINAEGTFYVNMSENVPDADFEDLILLYRPDNYSEFRPIKFKKIQYNENEGLVIVKKLKFGQYITGINI